MLANYFKIALRALLRFKGYAFINIFGLAIGLMAGILIMVYVFDELSFDQFHANKDRIYRVTTAFHAVGEKPGPANDTNGWPVGRILEQEYPEVESVVYTRFSGLHINQGDKLFWQRCFFVGEDFFKMFSFPLLEGNPATAVKDPYSIVISESMATKFFPGQDALGKTLVFADTLNMLVTGVMKNLPSQSHIQADIFLSFATYQALVPEFNFDEGWGNINLRNYVMLKPGADFNAFQEKTKNLYVERAGEMMKNWGTSATIIYEPLTDIYLKTKAGNGMGPKSSIDRIYLLSGVAAFVIILACINFINIATARSVYRAKEVGLRKVVGSNRSTLIGQFLGESFLVSIISLALAILLVVLFLPVFNQLLNKSYTLEVLGMGSTLAGMIALVLAIAFLAGYYPARVLSGMKPSQILAGRMHSGSRGVGVRRFLVVFQFFISIGLVTGTFVVINQLRFMQGQDLGFNRNQVLVVNTARVLNPKNPNIFNVFKNELANLAMVSSVSSANAVPGTNGWNGQIAYPEGKTGDDAVSVEYIGIDDHYIETIGLQVIAGQGFSKDHPEELKDGLLLNETAVKVFGWASPEEALGKRIESPSGYPAGKVIGIIKDYHHDGLQQKIGPITFDYNPDYLYPIRYKAEDTQALVSSVQKIWDRMFPGYEFNYFFLDDRFALQYQTEERLARVLAIFSGFTIAIAVIGMIGLVSFMVVARTKEIGVRKVLGASVLSLSGLLTREFVVLVVIAGLVATPLTWFGALQWLDTFAYRMPLDPTLFVVAIVGSVLIAILAVSFQTIRAAMSDPVNSLRYE